MFKKSLTTFLAVTIIVAGLTGCGEEKSKELAEAETLLKKGEKSKEQIEAEKLLKEAGEEVTEENIEKKLAEIAEIYVEQEIGNLSICISDVMAACTANGPQALLTAVSDSSACTALKCFTVSTSEEDHFIVENKENATGFCVEAQKIATEKGLNSTYEPFGPIVTY